MSYTIEEANEIMRETSRILASDAKREKQQRVTARAAAITRPPVRAAAISRPILTASNLYFDAVEERLAQGETVREAKRFVAIHQRSILDAYLREFTEKQRAKSRSRTARTR